VDGQPKKENLLPPDAAQTAHGRNRQALGLTWAKVSPLKIPIKQDTTLAPAANCVRADAP